MCLIYVFVFPPYTPVFALTHVQLYKFKFHNHAQFFIDKYPVYVQTVCSKQHI